MRRVCFLCSMGLAGIFIMSCNAFPGILYPRVKFSITYIDHPPSSSTDRLEAGDKYPQAIDFCFSRAGNSFKSYFVPCIFTNKLYRSLHVKSMAYEYDDVRGIFLQDKTFALPLEGFSEGNGWYWRNGIGSEFFSINFEKVFKNKKPGDEFTFKIMLVYSFDDNEEEITQVLEYYITAIKGRYVSLFMGW